MPPSSSAQTLHLATAPFICLQCRLRTCRQAFRYLSTATRLRHQAVLHASPTTEPVAEVSGQSPPKGFRIRQVTGPTRPILPKGPARTRFAPSPTGHLHIGGLRTALFSYLLAKRTEGQFLLRIEDTDQKRLVPDAEAKLYQDLKWAGLDWDEGPMVGGPHGPYKQSERTHIYQAHARQLFAQSSAYACFCTPQTTTEQQSQSFVTSGCYQGCASLGHEEAQRRAEVEGKPYTLRLRPPPDADKRIYPDLVHGRIQRLKRSPARAPVLTSPDDGGDVDVNGADTILMKSDGTPTYHFANVVDDHLMGITHVIRGSEWMASTPLHYDIYSAFGWQPPQFAHVGLLLDMEGAKLSKRGEGLSFTVAGFREEHGVSAPVLNNYLALLGWSNPTNNDVMDMDTLISNFDLKFTRTNAVVTMTKLHFLARKHVQALCDRAVEHGDLRIIKDFAIRTADEVRKLYPEPICNGEITLSENPEVFPDRLSAYCADIIMPFRSQIATPAYVGKSFPYFFEYKPDPAVIAEMMHSSPSSRLCLPPNLLHDHSKQMAEAFEWDAAHQAPPANLAVGCKKRGFEILSQRLRDHLHYWMIYGAFSLPFEQNSSSPMATDLETRYFGRASQDAHHLAAKYSDSSVGLHTTPAVVADLLTRHPDYSVFTSDQRATYETALNGNFTEWSRMFYTYLRKRLLGADGTPAVYITMALLGEKECRRRLGLD